MKLKTRRAEHDLTQEQVSVLLGMHQSTYSRIEKGIDTGKIKRVPIDVVNNLARLFDIHPNDIMFPLLLRRKNKHF